MRKKIVRGTLSVLAVTWCLGGQITAQETPPPGEERGKHEEILLEGAYIVQEGDTLWAIAGRYLNDPRQWPQIWKENAFVSDPNKIFPGDPIAIPGVTPPPKPVAETPPVPPVGEERVAPPEVPLAEAPPVEGPPKPAPPEVAAVEKPEEVVLGLVAPPSGVIPRLALECSGFVARPREIEASGQIIRSLEAGDIRLWYDDHVFVDMHGRKVKVGDRFWVIRPAADVTHPVTGRSVGVKVLTLGTVEIVQAEEPHPWAKIVYNCEDMADGDLLVNVKAWAEPPKDLDRPADLHVGGYIVASKSDADSLGQWDVVYVDVGQDKGIIPGDEFTIYQRSGITKYPSIPLKRGELIVIRTSAESAVALVTKAELRLEVGEGVILQRQRQ